MKTAGIDIGSITTKAVILDDKKILGSKIIFTGYQAELAGKEIFAELLEELALDANAIGHVIATGYGRNSVRFASKTLTEIICHAAGAYYLNPCIRLVIDVGGQDSKVMVLDTQGKVKDFLMNDKCAAGTGRFLEVMARALEVDLASFAALSLRAQKPARISNLCTVFAESEVISLIATGEPRENIIAGIHEAMSTRVAALVHRIGLVEPIMLTGGVAQNAGFVKALEQQLGKQISTSPYAQVNGALGAAVLAKSLPNAPYRKL